MYHFLQECAAKLSLQLRAAKMIFTIIGGIHRLLLLMCGDEQVRTAARKAGMLFFLWG